MDRDAVRPRQDRVAPPREDHRPQHAASRTRHRPTRLQHPAPCTPPSATSPPTTNTKDEATPSARPAKTASPEPASTASPTIARTTNTSHEHTPPALRNQTPNNGHLLRSTSLTAPPAPSPPRYSDAQTTYLPIVVLPWLHSRFQAQEPPTNPVRFIVRRLTRAGCAYRCVLVALAVTALSGDACVTRPNAGLRVSAPHDRVVALRCDPAAPPARLAYHRRVRRHPVPVPDRPTPPAEAPARHGGPLGAAPRSAPQTPHGRSRGAFGLGEAERVGGQRIIRHGRGSPLGSAAAPPAMR